MCAGSLPAPPEGLGRDRVRRGGGHQQALGQPAPLALTRRLDQAVGLQDLQVVVDLLAALADPARQLGGRCGHGQLGQERGADPVQRGGRGGRLLDDLDVEHGRIPALTALFVKGTPPPRLRSSVHVRVRPDRPRDGAPVRLHVDPRLPLQAPRRGRVAADLAEEPGVQHGRAVPLALVAAGHRRRHGLVGLPRGRPGAGPDLDRADGDRRRAGAAGRGGRPAVRLHRDPARVDRRDPDRRRAWPSWPPRWRGRPTPPTTTGTSRP